MLWLVISCEEISAADNEILAVVSSNVFRVRFRTSKNRDFARRLNFSSSDMNQYNDMRQQKQAGSCERIILVPGRYYSSQPCSVGSTPHSPGRQGSIPCTISPHEQSAQCAPLVCKDYYCALPRSAQSVISSSYQPKRRIPVCTGQGNDSSFLSNVQIVEPALIRNLLFFFCGQYFSFVLHRDTPHVI